ncbi:MAG: hypothetical protein ACM3KR_07435 [Deltaproteobacteria bacterium]
MNNDEMEEMIKNHFHSTETVNTELLIQKLKPVILHKCEEIKRRQNNITQMIIFIIGCVITLFIGGVILFPDYIDYSSEIVEFAGIGLTIAIFSALVWVIFKAILANGSNSHEIELRERII